MKWNRHAGSLIAVLFLLFVGSCAGSKDRDAGATEGNVVVAKDRVVTGDLFTGGRAVRILGEIRGDLAAGGAEVTVTGPVNGYVMSAGRSVKLDGRIANDVWAAGATVDIGSQIGDNLMAAGRSVHVHPGATIGHDAHLAGNEVTAEGKIENNLSIGAASARIGGEVGGTVEVRAERVTVQPDAVIHGDLVVTAPQPPDVSPQAKISGAIRFQEAEARPEWQGRLWLWVLCFLALLILGLAVIGFSATWVGRVAETMGMRPGASALVGLLVLVLTPLVAAGLMMAVIGAPLGLLLLAFYAVALLLSAVFTSYRTGSWLLDRMHRSNASRWARLLLGVFIVSIGINLPVVGWIFGVVVLIAGVGALMLRIREGGNWRRGSPSLSSEAS